MDRVYIEIDGKGTLAGFIEGEEPCFRYAPEYLEQMARPISLQLPLQEEAFSPQQTKIFFDGLLPEGFTRQTVARELQAEAEDYLTILEQLGNECLGALRIEKEGAALPAPGYEKLTKPRVRALAAEGQSMASTLVTKAHLSLAGATGKVGLYHEPKKDQWYLPLGTAPSTHIVKQSHVRFADIVTNEQLCMRTAKALGIHTADSFIVNTGDGLDEQVLFATARYDRILPEPGAGDGPEKPPILDGLPVPRRLHQEDFAQAMGKPAAAKYESPGRTYLADMFAVLRAYSQDPLTDSKELWDRVVLCYLLGNTDAHIKNTALLYSSNLGHIRLSPAYDLVSTVVYGETTRDMAMNIGGIQRLDQVDREAFSRAATQVGLGQTLAMNEFDRLKAGFEKALKQSAKELKQEGFPRADKLAKAILQKGGMAVE